MNRSEAECHGLGDACRCRCAGLSLAPSCMHHIVQLFPQRSKLEGESFVFGRNLLEMHDGAMVDCHRHLWWQIGDSEEALAKARKHWPTAFFTKMKAGSSPGVLEDATYIAFPQVIFTHAGVPDDVVYAMAKAIYEGKDAMAGTFKPFNAFNPADVKGDPGIAEFHPGALKFFKEAGLD